MPGIKALAAFYDAVESYALSRAAMAADPDNPYTNIAVGSLKLHIASYGGEAPWDLIVDFAQMLKAMTIEDGFTGFYEAGFFHAALGTTVFLTLHLAQVAAAA